MASPSTELRLGGSSSVEEQLQRAPKIPRAFAGETPSFLDRIKLRLSSDEELVARLHAGLAEALAVLFERHHARVFHSALRILRNQAEAEDLMQQVFLDLFRAAGKFRAEKGTFKTWLMMLTYCRAVNRWRQLRPRGGHTPECIEKVLPALLEGANRTFPFHPAEASRLLEQALAAIQPRQRRTIELIYYEGLTPEEVAERTGESVRVVRHNLYRGLERARGLLRRGSAFQSREQGK